MITKQCNLKEGRNSSRTSIVSSAQILSITHTTSDVSLLLQGVAALCLEMALEVQCRILSKYFQFLDNTHDLPTWGILTQNANQPFMRKPNITSLSHLQQISFCSHQGYYLSLLFGCSVCLCWSWELLCWCAA